MKLTHSSIRIAVIDCHKDAMVKFYAKQLNSFFDEARILYNYDVTFNYTKKFGYLTVYRSINDPGYLEKDRKKILRWGRAKLKRLGLETRAIKYDISLMQGVTFDIVNKDINWIIAVKRAMGHIIWD